MSGSIPVRWRDGGGLHVRWMAEILGSGTPLRCRGEERRPVYDNYIYTECRDFTSTVYT